MRKLRLVRTARHSKRKPFTHKELYPSSHILLKVIGGKRSLDQPFEGPYEVLERVSDTVFKIKVNDETRMFRELCATARRRRRNARRCTDGATHRRLNDAANYRRFNRSERYAFASSFAIFSKNNGYDSADTCKKVFHVIITTIIDVDTSLIVDHSCLNFASSETKRKGRTAVGAARTAHAYSASRRASKSIQWSQENQDC